MNTRDFCSGAPRRVTALFLAGFAAAVLADDPSVTLPNKFEAPDISNMPLSMGSEVPPNVMLLINTGSITHYGYLPTNGDRYDLRSSAFGTTNPSRLNKPFHSSHINKIYYDPAVEYKRPLGFQPGTTTEWPDASFASAPIDGFGVFNSGMSTKNRNLANNFCATHYADSNSVIDDCVDAPAYKTDGTGGPSTGTTIGRTAHYNLYHPGRVARNADGSVKVNPSVKDAGGNETWQDIRAIPAYVSGSMNVPIQYIVNKGGEAHLTYGTAENPARQGCEFQDTSMSATSRTDYSKFGKFGSGQSDYVFPAGYDYTSSSSTTGSTDVSDSSVVSNPQYQFTTGNDRNHNWLIKYYNCFEAIRVGEAEDKDEYYTWWDAAKNGPIEAADKRQNFANWFSYYYHPGSLMKTVLSHALNDLDPETRIGYAVTGCNSGCGSSSGWGGTYGSGHMLDGFDSKNNYVKRGVRPFKDFDPGDPSGYGVGGQGAAACSPAGKCKTQVLDWLFKLSGSSSDYAGYASMRQSLAGVGTYYTNNTKKGPWSSTPGFERAANAATGADATRFQSCRKSYVLTLTGGNFDTDDGKPLDDMRDADNKSGPSILHANESDTYGTTPYVYVPTLPFKDHNTNTLPTSLTTMADVAMHYWKNDLLMRTVDGRSDNNVPRGTQDPAFWQHMNVVAIHLDDSAYSVDWQRITKAMNMNPTDAKAMFDANDWGYPGPAYAASCGSSWTNGPGCPVPPMSGWGNPDRNDRENQPENLLNGDDLMHAAINSRGFYASTLNPSEISGLIQQGLSFVRTDNAISMSSAATNTTSSQVPMIYQASFNDDWNGKLIGNRLCTSADVARDYAYNPANGQSTLQQNDSRCREEGTLWFKASWDAGKALQTQIGSRSLYTWNPAASAGMNLSAASLNAAQKTAFCETPACADEVAYLQGMDTHEARNGGPWRSRINAFKTDETVDRNKTAAADGAPRVLGDLINSSVLFVGRDDYGWAGFGGITYDMRQGYRQRKAVPRAEVLYVGGNDGMLHAFYADAGSANGGTLGSAGNGGKEIFAYVPYAVWDKLKALRDPEYTHEFYVDGSPTVGDAYLANSNSTHGWNTVLIGSTGAGGSGYFALDVEKPENFGAGSVLWDIRGPTVEIQYSGATATKVITAAPHTPDFVDLGYTLGQAAIMPVMTKTGDTHKWVAVFPNGYNSYLDRPMLYIVNLKDGALETGMRDNLGLVNYTTATTGNSEGSPTDPNGLSTPVLADVNGDGIVDVIYAGDLRGNLWRFRLNGGGAVDTAKIFEARDADGNSQPITARPEVGRDKTGNVMVYFGTGRYVARSDLADNSVQTFYGVRDICVMDTTSPGCTSGGALHRGNLLRQEFMGPDENRAYETGYDATIRVVSNHSMSDESGFYLDFKAQGSSKDMGERVIHTPLLWSDRLIFSTIIPNDDECEPGGDGWMYELDPSDGSRLEFAVFDLDHDGKFGDINDLSADGIPPSGLKVGMGSGVTARGDTKYHSNIKGKVTSIKNNKHPEMGRKSWRQLQ